MLYLTAGYHTLDFHSLSVDLGGWLGQSYYGIQLRGKIALTSTYPSYLELEGVLNRQKFYDKEILFYESDNPSFVDNFQDFIRIQYSWSITKPAKGYVSLTYGREADTYYPKFNSDYFPLYKDKNVYHIAALKGGLELNTLNNLMYPSEGKEWNFNFIVDHEESQLRIHDAETLHNWHHQFNGSIELLWQHYFLLHKKFSLGAMANGLVTFSKLYQDYTSTLAHVPAFAPTPSTKNYFNEGFRSPNYLAAGLIPIWMPFNRAQLRGNFYAFCPIKYVGANKSGMAYYDGWFKHPQCIAEVDAVYNFPFASMSVYVNYLSHPKNNWNFGINFGLFFKAPRLLR